jgi:hypothetical protein
MPVLSWCVLVMIFGKARLVMAALGRAVDLS